MEKYQKELTPVSYNQAAIRKLSFLVGKHEICFPMHWHERLEIIVVNEGKLCLNIGKDVIVFGAGEMAVIAPRYPHKGYTEEKDTRYDVLMFDVRSFYNETDICKEYLAVLLDGGVRFKRVIQEKNVIECFENIVEHSEEKSMWIIAEIYKLIYLLLEYGIEKLNVQNIRDKATEKMIKYIEEHFREEMTVESLAKQFGYSKEHFCRKFKEATGLAPMKYLGIYRIEMAEKLLKYSKYSVSEAAEQCGFYDANYFTRRFKAHFGMAPTKYIKKEDN